MINVNGDEVWCSKNLKVIFKAEARQLSEFTECLGIWKEAS